jgi:hypothetical protein
VPSQTVHVRITAIEGPDHVCDPALPVGSWPTASRPHVGLKYDCARCVAVPTKADSEPRRSARI